MLCLATPVVAQQKSSIDQFRVHGLSAFSEEKQQLLSSWLTTGVNATRYTLGVYPQVLELYLYAKKSNQPVPWAHTRRDEKESVHFYVDSRFPLNKFVNDWTIYHELAHLALPYLGANYSWFSEGFASYMQYQIMQDADILQGTLTASYRSKIGPHLRWFNSQLPPAEVARRLMGKQNYPAGYWGGAYFFVLAEQQLKVNNHRPLTHLIRLYQECCRTKDQNIHDVMRSLDSFIQDDIFSNLLQDFEQSPANSLYPVEF
jgi:hypothetical protein